MELAEIEPIINRWVASGLLSDFNRELLKAEYAKLFGLPGSCNACYWNDVQTYYRLQIRKSNMKKVTAKYIVNPEFGSIRVFNSNKLYVTEGSETASTLPLTDEVAERLLGEAQGYAEMILPNPELAKTAAKQQLATDQQAQEPTGTTNGEETVNSASSENGGVTGPLSDVDNTGGGKGPKK